MTGTHGKYMLRGHEVVPCHDLIQWAQWFETADRTVARTAVSDDIAVSTVFLGLDHAFGARTPLLFETMIFGGPENGWCERYSTWDDAVEGHARAVQRATDRRTP